MTVSYFVNYRKQGDTTWSRWPSDGSTLNTLSTVVGQNPPGPALAPSQGYEFEVIATNAFGSSTSTISQGTTTSGVAFQSIVLNPAAPTFTAGFTGSIASVVVTMTSGSFSGGLTVTTGSTNFSIVNGQLQVTNANLAAGPQSFTIQATQSNATNTPYSQGFTVQVGAALAESAEATVVKTTGQTIIGSRTNRVPSNGPFNYWQLTSGAQIQLSTDGTNYSVQPSTSGVTALLYHKDSLFQLNSGGNWWYWNTSTSDALAGTPGYVFYNLTGPVTLSSQTYTVSAAPGTWTATISCPMTTNAANDTFPGTWGGTYTLDSTSAATFQITGSTITNRVTLTQASYSPTITAALNVTGSDSTVYSVGHAISSPVPISQQGSNVIPITPPANLPTGWQIAFFDDFTTTNTVTTNTSGNGFNWFLNLSGRTPNHSILTTTNAAGISNGNTSGGNNASSAGGIWRQAGTNLVTDYNGVWTTCPGNNATTGVSGKNNYWKHAYFEAYLQWNATGWYGTGAWFPAFWSWSVNPSPVECEIDFMEQFQRHSTDNPGHAVSWGTSDPGAVVAGAVVRAANYENNHDNQWHTIACLWQSTGTGQGTLRFFMDGTQFGGTQATGSATGSIMVDLENTVAMHMTMGSGFNWDLYIDWVRVWTATGT